MPYLIRVRYPDGGGLTAEGRTRREAVRLQAAALFARDVPVPEIARRLRVWRSCTPYEPRADTEATTGSTPC
jgi:putative transposase